MRIPKTIWPAALLALMACSPAAALAQDTADANSADADAAKSGQAEAAEAADAATAKSVKATKPDAPRATAEAPQSDAPTPPDRPFIERTLVIAPEQVGKFKLYGMTDFPGNPGAGISVRYQHADFPTVRIDLYVYPAGRQDRDQVLARGMDEVRATLEHAAGEGKYVDLEIGAQTAFDLRTVAEDGSTKTADSATASAGERNEAPDAGRAIADAMAAQAYQRGLRLSARLTIQDEPQNSLAFLFYRGLYLLKGRISAPPELLPGEAFDRFADHAMASLVPLLSTRSTGGCSRSEILLGDEDFTSETALAGKLAAASELKSEEACTDALDETVPAGSRAMPLVYTPAMWGGEG